MAMEPYQKINHFPGMHEICRKDHLARNLTRLSRLLPKDYNFSPKTFTLPHDWYELKHALKASRRRRKGGTFASATFIAKPDHGCQGKGIFLFNSFKGISSHRGENLIVQRYLDKPYLVDNRKFDLRVYVLVTSTEPLRVFMHRSGLARFATEQYARPSEANLGSVRMHLTNYAINKVKRGEGGVTSDGTRGTNGGSNREWSGPKQPMASIFDMLEERYGRERAEKVWDRIADLVVKTIVTVQPQISSLLRACFPKNVGSTEASSSSTTSITSSSASGTWEGSTADIHAAGSSPCFEILGFDIMLDHKLKPWVLEVNHSPSFACDSLLDTQVKCRVIGDALDLLNLPEHTNKRIYQKSERLKMQSRLWGKQNSRPSPARSEESIRSSLKRGSLSTDTEPMSAPRTEATVGDNGSARHSVDQRHSLLYDTAQFAAMTEFEDKHLGGYQRIFPPPRADSARLSTYLRCLDAATKLFFADDTTTTRARMALGRRRREEADLRSQAAGGGVNVVGTEGGSVIVNGGMAARARRRSISTLRKSSIGAPTGSMTGVAVAKTADRNLTQAQPPTPTTRQPLLRTRSAGALSATSSSSWPPGASRKLLASSLVSMNDWFDAGRPLGGGGFVGDDGAAAAGAQQSSIRSSFPFAMGGISGQRQRAGAAVAGSLSGSFLPRPKPVLLPVRPVPVPPPPLAGFTYSRARKTRGRAPAVAGVNERPPLVPLGILGELGLGSSVP
ncbi:tubulin-tyrosine ligase family-domain-containing protein [Zopfochytrium polystomum]|nr:tubulin-tyrosine ligase family-domain-containing protein [Zopfochytrium polystomum]